MRPATSRWKRWATVLLAAVALLGAWGWLEPRLILDERHEPAVIRNLPPAWVGQRIAVMGDMQIGMYGANVAMVRRAVRRIVELRPAAMLFTGDALYNPSGEEEPAEAVEEIDAEELAEVRRQIARSVALLRPILEAGIPVLAVLGNHDYLTEDSDEAIFPAVADALTRELRAAGITVLRNAAASVRRHGSELHIAGLDSLWARRSDPEAALAGIPPDAPRLVLLHNPDAFEALPPFSAPLAVAGHTHGGQIRVPGLPHWSWTSLFQQGRVTTDGWIRDHGAEGNRLYVNRGIGFSNLPLRINCPPELTVFTLQAEPTAGGR